MILYFSATGNSKYVAERIAGAVGSETFPITDFDCSAPVSGDIVGIVVPTYFWGLPSIVVDFLEKLRIGDCRYLFFVATCGTTPGATAKMAEDILGHRFDAAFSVAMPDTWTPTFDLSDKEKVKKQLEAGNARTEKVAAAIKERKKGTFMRFAAPKIIGSFAYSFYGKGRRTSTLSVGDNCIGCGLCAKKCPVQAIEMREERPVWVKEQCTMCLGCLHRCPKFAIQRGANTQKHGQYTNPNTTL